MEKQVNQNDLFGLNESDTIEDALKRADGLAGRTWHSGMMCGRKDLRRIVLLVREYRKLKTENTELKSIKESLKISLAEQEQIVGKVINELLLIRGGHS